MAKDVQFQGSTEEQKIKESVLMQNRIFLGPKGGNSLNNGFQDAIPTNIVPDNHDIYDVTVENKKICNCYFENRT